MALFQPSTLSWGQAKTRVAGVAGSAGDSDQLIMAGYFLEEAFRAFEAAKDWKYLFASTTISITAGTSDYNLPSDFRKIYNVRVSVGNPRVLQYIDKRDYDLLRPDQSAVTTPTGYMLTGLWNNSPGKITLVPNNALTDSMIVNYYRNITIPDAIVQGTTASDSATLDIPIFYQGFLLAWARALYLASKGGEEERQRFWANLAQEGLLKARAADEFVPDDLLAFGPAPNRINSPYDPNNVMPWAGDF